jgi:hypothetical protein
LLLPVEISTAPGHETGKGRTAVSPKLCSEKQELRFLLLQCHAPPRGSTLFAAIKDPWRRKRGLWGFGLFAWLVAFCFGGAFTLGLLVWEAFGRGSAKEGLIESLHREL